jgi:hypothetical protein
MLIADSYLSQIFQRCPARIDFGRLTGASLLISVFAADWTQPFAVFSAEGARWQR